MQVGPTDALIVVDVQKDFCPGGALAVDEGDQIVPTINSLLPRFRHVYFTRDWHPPNHCSFAETPAFTDGSWPPHCVAGTAGAGFHDDLQVIESAEIIEKGTRPDREAYSGFDGTRLAEDLKGRGVDRIVVCGLATDYCVKHTALDGRKSGFSVAVVQDACRGVDNPHGAAEETIQGMNKAGVTFIDSGEIR